MVIRGKTAKSRTAYMLVDVAESGLRSVLIRVTGIEGRALNGRLELTSHAAAFTVGHKQAGSDCRPTVTVTWMNGRSPETWVGDLP